MNIVIVDENYWVAQGIRALLTSHNRQLMTCASIKEVKRLLLRQSIDVLVVELRTDVDDVEKMYVFLRLLQALYPRIRMIILTEITDTALLNFFANTLGSADVLTKKSSVETVSKSINRSGEYTNKTIRKKKASSLSSREFNMLKWFSQYSSQSDIATLLNLNNKTISYYKRSISIKLRCDNNAQFYARLNQYGFNRMMP